MLYQVSIITINLYHQDQSKLILILCYIKLELLLLTCIIKIKAS